MKRLIVGMLTVLALVCVQTEAGAATEALTGPTGWCLNYTGGPSSIGTGTVTSSAGGVSVSAGITRAEPGHYTIYLSTLNVSRGRVIGCATLELGGVDVPASGAASFTGWVGPLSGRPYFQVVISQGEPFATTTGWATAVMRVTL